MAHAKFLELLQAVEAQRRCEGKECFAITDENVTAATITDGARSSHLPENLASCEAFENCHACADIKRQEIALRETLHSQGVDFPAGMISS